MPNRLSLEVTQNLASFLKVIDSEYASGVREIETAFSKVVVERAYGFRLNLEDDAVLIMPVFEVLFDLTKLINEGRSALLKSTAPLSPQFKQTRLLLAWTGKVEEGKSPFLKEIDPELKRYAWQIVLGSLSSLAKTGAPNMVALAEFPTAALNLLADQDLHDYSVASTQSFLAGLPNADVLSSMATGRTIFKHKMHLVNNQLKQSFGLKVTV